MVQWVGVHLPVQRIWVQSLVWEDSACLGAAEPVHQVKTPQLERARAQQLRSSTARKEVNIFKKESGEYLGGGGCPLQAKKRGLRMKPTIWHLDLGLLASRTVRKEMSVV